MRLVGFSFSNDRVGIQTSGRYFDLHNNYLLRSHDRNGSQLRLFWSRLNEHWVAADQPETIVLEILGVSYFEVRGEPSDDLDEIGFFDSSTFGKVDYNGRSSPTPTCDVLVFRFIGGGEIAVRGQSVSVHSGPE
jgi:hypothetical protein